MLTYPNQEAVSTRELAWNTAGTNLTENLTDGTMTAAEALEKSGLAGWNVRKIPMVTALGDHAGAFNDAGLTVPDQFAMLADIKGKTNVLGVTGSRFKVFQNEETTDLLDAIVDEGGANIEAMGMLDGGRKTFGVMKMPNGILIGGEDAHDLTLGFTNAHDGSGSLRLWVSALRLACTNMLPAAWKGAKQKWSLRHTGELQGRVAEAREALSLTFEWAKGFEGMVERDLLGVSFSDAEFQKFLDSLEPESKSEHEGWVKRQSEKRDTLRFLFNEAETNEFGRGTKWAAYNAFTEYADWYMPVKSDDALGTKRAGRILGGAAVANFKQTALDALVAA